MKFYSSILFAAFTYGLFIDKEVFQKRDITPVGSLLYSKQVVLDGNSYYVPNIPAYTIGTGELNVQSGGFGDALLFPLTVVDFSELSTSSVVNISSEFTEKDDVFSESFLETLVVTGDNIGSLNLESSSSLLIASTPSKITHGPYFGSYSNGILQIFEAYRLYSDFFQTFQVGIVPDSNSEDGFEVLPAAVGSAHSQTVAVPSRLYFTPSEEKPLSGYRVAIKDLYDIKGIKTSGGSRDYFKLYPEATENSYSVQKLIDLGAIIVGKVKLSQFANGESATADYVDYHGAFNPRGDGYQQASSSSAGSGAAEAAYDWLDFTVGSDTGCSVRCPANSQGLFGIRPTWNAISLAGVIPMSASMDTAGYFARDAHLFKIFGDAWYGNESTEINTEYTSYPKQITSFIDEDYSYAPDEVLSIYYDFMNKTADFLGADINLFNATDSFESSTNQSIEVTFNNTWGIMAGYEQYNSIWIPFLEDYKNAFDGDLPFLDPVPKFRWEYNYHTFGEEGYNNAVSNKLLVDSWFNSAVLNTDPETCSSSIYIYLSNTGATAYRNVYRTAPAPSAGGGGFSALSVSPFARTPEVVIPLAEVPYNSTITETEKFLPVTATFGAAPGCDFMLLDLLSDLQDAGIIKAVKTGSTMY